jgi:imidazolonepropionase-like amidohydrolase
MSLYLANVTLFDGKTVKTKQGVHVRDGAIEWVGAHSRAPRTALAASPVDGTGMTLTPGLIDCHVHLQFDGGADFATEGAELIPNRYSGAPGIRFGNISSWRACRRSPQACSMHSPASWRGARFY